MICAGDVIRRVVSLTVLQALLSFILLRIFGFEFPVGWYVFGIGAAFFVLLLIKRMIERWFLKLYRQDGRNTRDATFVGANPELITLFDKMKKDPTLVGLNVLGNWCKYNKNLLNSGELKVEWGGDVQV